MDYFLIMEIVQEIFWIYSKIRIFEIIRYGHFNK